MAVGRTARYLCGDEERRAAVRRAIAAGVAINGIDFLEVIDSELEGTPAEPSRQHILLLQFFDEGIGTLGIDHVSILGGTRIKPIHVTWVHVLSAITAGAPADIPPVERQFLAGYRVGQLPRDRILAIGTAERGDYSTYRLAIVEPGETFPPEGMDPRLSEVEFSFKVECPSDLDCLEDPECPPEATPEPDIDYLSKDYLSFRRLMLDRLSAIAPDWKERNPADLGIALVELLAYVGDQLSYYQDAAANEAYLGTARQRPSLRRHARLVDYRLAEGSNSRAWVVMEVEAQSNADGAPIPPGSRLLTRIPGSGPLLPSSVVDSAMRRGVQVFETLTPVTIRESLNRLELYTWSNLSCCLPIGATAATLAGDHPNLEPGMLLMFEEVIGPETGAPADADPNHIWVVRLTKVEFGQDPVELVSVTEIEWEPSDALPFPLCVSAEIGSDYLPAVAVARGNVVAADHGLTVTEDLPVVPPGDEEYRPRLRKGVLVHTRELPAGTFAATALSPQSGSPTAPAVSISALSGEVWRPQFDLLGSDGFAQEFVAEVENDGRARLRFGDDVNGRRPSEGTWFAAEYRVGSPEAGNVGAGSIAHLVDGPSGVRLLRNPRPAFGSIIAESADEVRRYAPEAFRTQQRAVTADDYARMAEHHSEVQRAFARIRWTGSWYTVFVSIDRKGDLPVDSDFAETIRHHLNLYRIAGVDLEIRPPAFVGVHLRLSVCVKPGYERAAVKRALLKVFGNGAPGGVQGFFHQDRWTFGQPLYLSHLYERATSVAGVDSVVITTLNRWGKAPSSDLADGMLRAADHEILRLDNDPSLRENGLLEIELEGGI